MTSLSDSEIDEAILSVAEARWMKVARVISDAAKMMYGRLPNDDATYELFAKRLETLVQDGRLVAQGDIKKWRHCEVRKLDGFPK